MKLRPCLTCGNLSTNGSYCPIHQPRTGRGSTRQWRNIRLAVLQRDHYRCQQCGRPANHVDHVIPKARGGTDHPSNLQALCASCNLEKGAS